MSPIVCYGVNAKWRIPFGWSEFYSRIGALVYTHRQKESILLRYVISVLLISIFTSLALCAEPKAAPAVKPASKPAVKPVEKTKPATKPLQATVESVSGIVEVLPAGEKNGKWRKMKVGDILSEQTVIRTGLGAKAVLKFDDRGHVTVKSGTKIGISSFRKSGKLVKTRLGLKYGAIRAQVDSSRGANDFRVRTAAATLAATGTHGNIAHWGDFSFQCKGTGGSWRARTPRRTVVVRAGEWSNRKAPLPIGLAVAKIDSKIGDIHGGLTKIEVTQLQRNSGPLKTKAFLGRRTLRVIRRFIRSDILIRPR